MWNKKEPSASKEENPARPVLKLALIGSPVGEGRRTETKYAAARNLSRRPSRRPSRRLSWRLSRWLSRRLSQGQVCISNNSLISGAPNGSVPQNICSSRKIFAGWEIWKINMSLEVALEGTCCWGIDKPGCLRGFVVKFQRKIGCGLGANFTPRPHPISFYLTLPAPPPTYSCKCHLGFAGVLCERRGNK